MSGFDGGIERQLLVHGGGSNGTFEEDWRPRMISWSESSVGHIYPASVSHNMGRSQGAGATSESLLPAEEANDKDLPSASAEDENVD